MAGDRLHITVESPTGIAFMCSAPEGVGYSAPKLEERKRAGEAIVICKECQRQYRKNVLGIEE